MSAEQATLEEFGDLDDPEVYITSTASRGANVYHTTDCQHVAGGHKQVTLSSAKDRGLVECKACSGEVEPRDSSPENPCGAPTTDGGRCQNPAVIHGVCVTHLENAD